MPAPENIKPTSTMKYYMTNLAVHYQSMGFGHLTEIAPNLVLMYAAKLVVDMLRANDLLNHSRQTQINCQQDLTLIENVCIDQGPLNCQQTDYVDPDLLQQVEFIKSQVMLAVGAAGATLIGSVGVQLIHHFSSLTQRAWESIGGKKLQSKLVELELQLKGEQSPKDQFLHLLVKFFASHRYNCLEKESTQQFLDYLYDNGLESLMNDIDPDFSSVSYNSFEYNALKLFQEVTRPQDELTMLVPLLLQSLSVKVSFADDIPEQCDTELSPTKKNQKPKSCIKK